MSNYSSGIYAVDEMLNFDFRGNIVMPIWFKTVIDESGRPNLLAINILADIIYWYRPEIVRDETTGRLIGYRKKFKADLLQKSLGDYANFFNCPKTTVQRAFALLQELGVIKRIMRKEKNDRDKEVDVPYIELIPEALRKITYPESVIEEDDDEDLINIPFREEIGECQEHPRSNVEHPRSNVEHPRSNMEHPRSNMEHPRSNMEHPRSNVEHPRSNMEHPRSNMEYQYSISNLSSVLETTTENNYTNKSSSNNNILSSTTNILNNISIGKKEEEEEKLKLRELKLREKIDIDKFKKEISPVIVDALMVALVKRGDNLFESISDLEFSNICLDVLSYPQKISNIGAFMSKCLDNFCLEKERSKLRDSTNIKNVRAAPKKTLTSFHNFEQHDYDFDEIERIKLGKSTKEIFK